MPTPTPISPELALVDPDLAAAARARLPLERDCLDLVPLSQLRPRRERPAARRRASTLDRAASTALWAVLLLLLGSSFLAFLPGSSAGGPSFAEPSVAPGRAVGASPDSGVVPTERDVQDPVAAPTVPEPSPVDRGGAARRQVLTWPAIPDASVYNVIFVRGDERIDTWTTATRLVLPPATAAKGEPFTWFVYPGSPKGDRVVYGSVAAHGTARVDPAGIPRSAPPTG